MRAELPTAPFSPTGRWIHPGKDGISFVPNIEVRSDDDEHAIAGAKDGGHLQAAISVDAQLCGSSIWLVYPDLKRCAVPYICDSPAHFVADEASQLSQCVWLIKPNVPLRFGPIQAPTNRTADECGKRTDQGRQSDCHGTSGPEPFADYELTPLHESPKESTTK